MARHCFILNLFSSLAAFFASKAAFNLMRLSPPVELFLPAVFKDYCRIIARKGKIICVIVLKIVFPLI
jgi:hypothetical protein